MRIDTGCMERFGVFLLVLGWSWFAVQAVGQDKETLGTKVMGNGDVISLTWDAKHPWDAEMMGRGANLMAEYMTANRGAVSERLKSGKTLGPGSRLIQFTLPDHLTNEPKGAVCLYFLLGNQHVLPIRKVSAQARDTSRFRYMPWEDSAQSTTVFVRHKESVDWLRNAVQHSQTQLSEKQRSMAAQGWTNPGACEQASVSSFGMSAVPADVLPVAQHEAAARRVCSSRVTWNQRKVDRSFAEASTEEEKQNALRLASAFVQEPEIIGVYLVQLEKAAGGRDSNLLLRRRQFNEFSADYKRWSGSAMDYKNPVFGQFDDEFQVQSLVRMSSLRVLAKLLKMPKDKDPDYADIAGFVGGSLEAYSRCVTDGQSQLRTKLNTWNELQTKAPELEARARVQMVQACRKGFDDLDVMKADVKKFQIQLEEEERVRPPDTTSTTVLARPVVLNTAACSVQ